MNGDIAYFTLQREPGRAGEGHHCAKERAEGRGHFDHGKQYKLVFYGKSRTNDLLN